MAFPPLAIDHILTTQRKCLEFDFELILGKRPIINRNKYEWETLNTPKIKVVFYSDMWVTKNDYGTKLRFKCHQRIERKAKTIESELCTNWELIDSFGVRLDLDGSVHPTDGYEKFYDDSPVWPMWWEITWLLKYTTANHGALPGEKGFILKNGTFDRFEPIGITWIDNYCRRITD